MEAVYLVTGNDVFRNLADVISVFLKGRIENVLSVIDEIAAWMLVRNMIGCQGCGTLGLGSKRIDPRMDFHVALVALLYHPLQGIPIGLWRYSLTTC